MLGGQVVMNLLAWIPTDKTGPNIFARGLALTENQSEGPIV